MNQLNKFTEFIPRRVSCKALCERSDDPLVRACCQLGIVTDKATNFVYKNDSLQYILNAEGRARPVAAASGSDFVTKYIYDYFVKDHLGNVRSTIT